MSAGIFMADSTGTLFFKDKQARLFLALAKENKEWHLTDLAREAEVTYVHTSRFIGKCEDMGLVATERHGRIKRLFLTEKGRGIANSIQTIMSNIGQEQEPGKG